MANNKKLTLYLDVDLIEKAKEHAHREGVSVSEMVSNYFIQVTEQKSEPETGQAFSAEIESLIGIISGLDHPDARAFARDERVRHKTKSYRENLD
jgi:hypothetical protein